MERATSPVSRGAERLDPAVDQSALRFSALADRGAKGVEVAPLSENRVRLKEPDDRPTLSA
jgi:hypothetical protein